MLIATKICCGLLVASGAVDAHADREGAPYIVAESVSEYDPDDGLQVSEFQPSEEAQDPETEMQDPDAAPDIQDDGTIIVSAPEDVPADPMGDLNAGTFEVAREMDAAVIEPVVGAYERIVPEPVRDGLDNFTKNLNEPVNFVNFLLQLKIGKAMETLARFTINSTIGVGGVFDVAKSDGINLPYRQNGFANTLGVYGIDPGPYLFLPVIGSTTARDLVGDTLDGLFLPRLVGRPFNRPEYSIPVTSLRAVNRRIEFEERHGEAIAESLDPYATNRDIYLEERQREIDVLRGRIPDPLSPDPSNDDVPTTEAGSEDTSAAGRTEKDIEALAPAENPALEN